MLANLSIIIPAKNEEDNLPKLIPSLFKRYDKYILEIIVVNDNSSDNSKNLLRSLMKRYPKLKAVNRNTKSGVGYAIKIGIKNLSPKSKYVLFMDCDFIINIPDIEKLIKSISHYDGVVGSRFLEKNSLTHYPLLKHIANRSYQILSQIILRIPHSDLTNNFKLYKKYLVDKIYPLLTASDFAINAELGFYPVLLGEKIGQVPVHWQERGKQMGLSKFKIFRVGPSYFKVFLKMLLMKYTKYNIPSLSSISTRV